MPSSEDSGGDQPRSKVDSIKNAAKSAWSFTERAASWVYLIPLLIIIGLMYYFGLRLIYIGVLIVASLWWNYWGSKMTMKDPKLVLVVDIEKQKVDPIYCGRRLWSRLIKNAKGKPTVNFTTSDGLSVELVKVFDPENGKIEFPLADDYPDLKLAMMPDTVGEIIDDLHKTRKEIMTLKAAAKIDALKEAQEHIARLENMLKTLVLADDKKAVSA